MLNISILGDVVPLVPKIAKSDFAVNVIAYSNSVAVTEDGEYYAIFPDPESNYTDQYVIGFSSDAKLQYSLRFSDSVASTNSNARLVSISVDSTGRLILVGNKSLSVSSAGSIVSSSIALVILDKDGTVLANRCFSNS